MRIATQVGTHDARVCVPMPVLSAHQQALMNTCLASLARFELPRLGILASVANWNGTKWTAFQAGSGTQDDVNVIVGTAANKVWAFGFDRLMWLWNGTTWIDKSDPFFEDTFDIYAACVTGTTVIVGGYYRRGSTNLAQFEGGAWTPATTVSASDVELYDVWTFNRDNAFAFGAQGTILQRDTNGWSVVPHGLTTEPLHSAWASSETDLYAATDNGAVLHYDGARWSIVASGPATLYDMSGSGPDDVWIIGPSTLWHWDGFAWLDRSSELPDPGSGYAAVYVAPGGDLFLAGEKLVRFDGTTWTSYDIQVTGSSPSVAHMWGSSASNIINLSMPGAMPPCGGAPYSNASNM